MTDDAGATCRHRGLVVRRSTTACRRASIAGPATAARGVALDFTGSAPTPTATARSQAREWDVDGDGFDDGKGAAKHGDVHRARHQDRPVPRHRRRGATAVASHEVTVTNRRRAARLPGRRPPRAASSVQFTGSATDPDGTVAELAWDTDGDGFDDGTGTTLKTTFASLGTKTVRLRVTDSDGGTFVTQTTLDVVNRQPAVDVDRPGRRVRRRRRDLTATASDPDGAARSPRIAWDTDGDGFDDGAGRRCAPRSPRRAQDDPRAGHRRRRRERDRFALRSRSRSA